MADVAYRPRAGDLLVRLLHDVHEDLLEHRGEDGGALSHATVATISTPHPLALRKPGVLTSSATASSRSRLGIVAPAAGDAHVLLATTA